MTMNRITGGGNIATLDANQQRRRTSISLLLFLTGLSAIVTIFYDANLSPYSSLIEQPMMSSSGSGSGRTSMRTTEGSSMDNNNGYASPTMAGVGAGGSASSGTVDFRGEYVPSQEQRALARTMNMERKVSCVRCSCSCSCQ